MGSSGVVTGSADTAAGFAESANVQDWLDTEARDIFGENYEELEQDSERLAVIKSILWLWSTQESTDIRVDLNKGNVYLGNTRMISEWKATKNWTVRVKLGEQVKPGWDVFSKFKSWWYDSDYSKVTVVPKDICEKLDLLMSSYANAAPDEPSTVSMFSCKDTQRIGVFAQSMHGTRSENRLYLEFVLLLFRCSNLLRNLQENRNFFTLTPKKNVIFHSWLCQEND